VLVRLDQTIGTLLTGLDRLVGPDNYVVALSADHGVSPVPERAVVLGLDGGRVPVAAITSAIEDALRATLGPAQGQAQGQASVAKYVAHVTNSDVYLQPGVFERMADNPAALAAVRHALRAVPGVLDVYTRDRIEADRFDDDPIGRRLAHSFVPDRSGDLMVVLKPYWLTGAGGTSHGTPYGFDTRVPILMMGKGIVPGEYLQPATPADVAPTLAFLAGITLPRAQGRVLIEAIGANGPNTANTASGAGATGASRQSSAAPAPGQVSGRR
jgi:arylsulfatase A-like enzyme